MFNSDRIGHAIQFFNLTICHFFTVQIREEKLIFFLDMISVEILSLIKKFNHVCSLNGMSKTHTCTTTKIKTDVGKLHDLDP